MVRTEKRKKEGQAQEQQEKGAEQTKATASEVRDARLARINQQIAELSTQTSGGDSRTVKSAQEQEYAAQVAALESGLGTDLGEVSKTRMQENMVDSVVEQAQKDNERLKNLERLKKAAEVLSAEDFITFERFLGNQEGRVDQLYELQGRALHTTNDYFLSKISASGKILTVEEKGDGMYKSKGASFTDGDFPEAATFQTMYEDQNTHSDDKKFNTQEYDDKAEAFVQYLWNKDAAALKKDLSEKSGRELKTYQDVLDVALSFKFQARPKDLENDPEAMSKLFAVTISYEKDALPELVSEGSGKGESEFELRSHRDGGIPIADAATFFVPEKQIENMQAKLQAQGLSHIEVRASEELEVIRMVNILDK